MTTKELYLYYDERTDITAKEKKFFRILLNLKTPEEVMREREKEST